MVAYQAVRAGRSANQGRGRVVVGTRGATRGARRKMTRSNELLQVEQ